VSERRSRAANGNGCVIPAQAGIHAFRASVSERRSRAANGNGCVIPAQAGIHFNAAKTVGFRLRGNDAGRLLRSRRLAWPSDRRDAGKRA
jgi:hypothetical protein